jgi:hypothetical protein
MIERGAAPMRAPTLHHRRAGRSGECRLAGGQSKRAYGHPGAFGFIVFQGLPVKTRIFGPDCVSCLFTARLKSWRAQPSP